MLDVQNAPAAPPVTVRREDYRPPEWLVPEIALELDLGAERTIVRATLKVARNGRHNAPLQLDASGLQLVRVAVDGAPVNYWFEKDVLRIPVAGDEATVETEVAIAPRANTQLMGLYESGGLLCTQCEAEGFRRITPFPDRPDVLSRYRVRIIGDKSLYPILLSNGDPVAKGDLDGGRHWAEWHDPFPKPSYLFALVAGDLAGRHAPSAERRRAHAGRRVGRWRPVERLDDAWGRPSDSARWQFSRNCDRDRDQSTREQQADRPVRIQRHAVHAVRSRGFSPNHLLP